MISCGRARLGRPTSPPGVTTYYAFDCGGRHFLMLDSMEEGERQKVWIKKELALQPPDKELLVFQHYPPGPWIMDILSHYHTLAIFTGHRHTSRVFRYGKILYVNTPPFIFGGIDLSPWTFRLISFKDGKLRSTIYSRRSGNTRPGCRTSRRPRQTAHGRSRTNLGRCFSMMPLEPGKRPTWSSRRLSLPGAGRCRERFTCLRRSSPMAASM